MFNVKFCNFYENGSESTTGISCPHYSIYKRKDGSVEVVTYKSMADVDGVSRQIGSYDPNSTHKAPPYQACYIENAQGKTVETIRAIDKSRSGEVGC
jgi:hypothetical protein